MVKKSQTAKNKEKVEDTRDLYYASPASTKKVNLATTIIACFVAVAVGIVIGLGYEDMSVYFGGTKTASSRIDFNRLREVYEELYTY
jgi:hypothetical protein